MEDIKLWNGALVPRIGVGTWAIGGLTIWPDQPVSYGEVDDKQSKAGLNLAYEIGCRVFDTAAAYGAGNSELLIGDALRGKLDACIITKCGYSGDPSSRKIIPEAISSKNVRASVEASLRRLRRDRIAAVLLHVNDLPPDRAKVVFDELYELKMEGKIEGFGWSTDNASIVDFFSKTAGFELVENDFNIFDRAPQMMALVEEQRMISISRLPLAMGLLTGKYSDGRKLGHLDVRSSGAEWLKFFRNGAADAGYSKRLQSVREALMTGGRTLAQGALGWILAKSSRALPVPGFTRPEQVRENFGAVEKGPLPSSVMDEIERILNQR